MSLFSFSFFSIMYPLPKVMMASGLFCIIHFAVSLEMSTHLSTIFDAIGSIAVSSGRCLRVSSMKISVSYISLHRHAERFFGFLNRRQACILCMPTSFISVLSYCFHAIFFTIYRFFLCLSPGVVVLLLLVVVL